MLCHIILLFCLHPLYVCVSVFFFFLSLHECSKKYLSLCTFLGYVRCHIWVRSQSMFTDVYAQPRLKRKLNEKREEHFPSLSVHMLILFLCKCANTICMSKCLIFHSVSILISSAVPLMGYWLLCYVPFIISLFPHSSDVFWRGSCGGGNSRDCLNGIIPNSTRLQIWDWWQKRQNNAIKALNLSFWPQNSVTKIKLNNEVYIQVAYAFQTCFSAKGIQ